MAWIKTKDGTKLIIPDDMPDEMADAGAEQFERTGKLPPGFSLEQSAGGPLMDWDAVKQGAATVRDYATEGVSRAIQYLGDPSGTMGPGYKEATDEVAKYVVPQTPGEALMAVASMGLGKIQKPVSGILPTLKQYGQRVAATLGAGVAGSLMEGEGVTEGIKDAALPIAADTLLTAIPGAKHLYRSWRGPAVATVVDAPAMGKALEADFPALPTKQSPAAGLSTADDLHSGMHYKIKEQTGNDLDDVEKFISGAMRKQSINQAQQNLLRSGNVAPTDSHLTPRNWAIKHAQPTIKSPAVAEFLGLPPETAIPIDEAFAAKKQLRYMAYGDVQVPEKLAKAGYDARQAYPQMVDEIEAQIQQALGTDVMQYYQKANTNVRKAMVLSDYARGRDVQGAQYMDLFPGSGEFDLSAMQGNRMTPYAPQIEEYLPNVRQTVLRGGGPTTQDRLFEVPGARFLAGGGVAAQTGPLGFKAYGGAGSPVPVDAVMDPTSSAALDYLLFLSQSQPRE